VTVLIEALFINNGGGKELLDYLVQNTSDYTSVYFLLDERVKGHYDYLPSERVVYLKGSLIIRHKYYLMNKSKFTNVLCFGNIPPTVKLDAKVYTYFHNVLFIKTTSYYSIKSRVKFWIKGQIIKFFKNNTDFWVVQTKVVKLELANNWKVNQVQILILPIYNSSIGIFNNKDTAFLSRPKIQFLYVSDGHPYKNHGLLIEAFIKLYNTYKSVELILTVGNNYPELQNRIELLNQKGIPIINAGLIPKNKLLDFYINADIFIFPSLVESFGLGMIEAAQFEIPILASNLPFVHEVILPMITFNQNSTESIFSAMVEVINSNPEKPKIIIKNKLKELVELLVTQ
jgi:glycosyltransferase involved in cell wall biosynthesis